jgi:hypothetical protein
LFAALRKDLIGGFGGSLVGFLIGRPRPGGPGRFSGELRALLPG